MRRLISVLRARSLKRCIPLLFLRRRIRLQHERIGSSYGNWYLPTPESFFSDDRGVCLTGGVGEDLSFEFELTGRTMLTFETFDFTPRSKSYFDKVSSCTTNAIHTEDGIIAYPSSNPSSIKFWQIGLGVRKEHVEFSAPSNPNHVSFSIFANGQPTTYFPVLPIAEVIDRIDPERRSICKLDIEGSEQPMIKDPTSVRSIFSFRIVLIEMDYLRQAGLFDGIKYLLELRRASSSHAVFYQSDLNIGFVVNEVQL